MALRDMSAGGEMPTSGGASAVSGLPAFWDSADTAPKTEWEEWWDLFMVATNANTQFQSMKHYEQYQHNRQE